MKRRTVGLIATAGIIIIGAVFVARRGGGGVAVDPQPAARKAVFRSTVTASGQIVAQRYADIGSSVMGRLVELRVKEGDAVKAGQIVARIDAVQAAVPVAVPLPPVAAFDQVTVETDVSSDAVPASAVGSGEGGEAADASPRI